MLDREDILEIKRQLVSEILPLGTILIFPYEKCPECFLPCDGRYLNKQEYSALYELLGDTFGVDENNFMIPDLRGKFIRGYDDSGVYDNNHEFGAYQEDALQGHSHKANRDNQVTGASGEHSHLFYAEYWYKGSGTSDQRVHENKDYIESQYNMRTSSAGSHTHTLPDIHLGEMISSNRGLVRVASETRPKNIALCFCIKVK